MVGLTGVTGHLGSLLLERLLADPEVAEVRSVARRPHGGRARLTHTCADLRDAAARRALEGCDLLYHLAAQVWAGRGAWGRLETWEMESVNVDGARNVVPSALAVVLASSVAVYGAWPDNPLPLCETDEARPNPECPYAAHKLAAEQVCAQEARRWAIVRIPAVLGPHADARVTRAVSGYRLAVPAIWGSPQAVQWLHEEDAVEGLLATGRRLLDGLAGSRSPVEGEILNLGTEDWLGAADVARLAGSRVIALPRKALIGASEWGRRLALAPFGADRAALIDGPLAVSAAKAEALTGWRARKSSAVVLREALGRDWRGAPRNRAP